jgi:type III pantothenate kinase
MLLECDLGNSRCKWRLLSEGGVVSRGKVNYCDGLFEELLPKEKVRRVRAASVAGKEINQALVSAVKSRYGLRPEWASSQTQCAGVKNAYQCPEQLGIDRWLAVVAAYNTKGAAIVVDAGSALTLDVVSADGLHLGGYIVPGNELMSRSLIQGTAKVRYESESEVLGLSFGQDTAGSVLAGIAAAQLGVVNVAISKASTLGVGNACVLLTGGGAKAIADGLLVASEVCPELVLDGLQWVLP